MQSHLLPTKTVCSYYIPTTLLLYKSVNSDKVQLIWYVTTLRVNGHGFGVVGHRDGGLTLRLNSYIRPVFVCGMQLIHAQMFHMSCDHFWMWSGLVGEEKFVGSGFFLAALWGEFWRVWILVFDCNVKFLLDRARLKSDTKQHQCVHTDTNTQCRLLIYGLNWVERSSEPEKNTWKHEHWFYS